MFTRYRNAMLASGMGTGTVALYIRKLERFAITTDLLTADTEQLEAYIASYRDTLADNTRKSIRSAFASYYEWAYVTELITRNPVVGLRPVKVRATLPRVAPDDVVQMGLITAGTELTAMILLARYGCLRLTELTTLHMRQREGDLLRIVGKGEKQRLVPINEPLMHVLLKIERQQTSGYYFPGRYGGHMHTGSVHNMIKRHLGTNPHSLRHAGATAAYRATRDLRAVQLLLGHSSLATTERYLHVGMDDVRAVAAATEIPGLSVFPPTTLTRPHAA